MKHPLLPSLLLTLACDPSVVDAVREPMPLSPTAGSASGGGVGGEEGNGEPGAAGGEAGSGSAQPSPLAAALFHRYSFDGEGERAVDTRGGAHGQVMGTTLGGDGTLPLAGGASDQYLTLPENLISGLTDATFESWLTWHGGNAWQRIFDFGSNTEGKGVQGADARSYLFLTTSADTTRQPRAAIRLAYSQKSVNDEEVCVGTIPFPIDTPTHVAVVIDSRAQTMALYQDGAFMSECPLTRPLSAIDDVNNWLGRSNFARDVDLAATYDEFRMYDVALSAELVAESFAAGPDAPLTP